MINEFVNKFNENILLKIFRVKISLFFEYNYSNSFIQ